MSEKVDTAPTTSAVTKRETFSGLTDEELQVMKEKLKNYEEFYLFICKYKGSEGYHYFGDAEILCVMLDIINDEKAKHNVNPVDARTQRWMIRIILGDYYYKPGTKNLTKRLYDYYIHAILKHNAYGI